MDLGLIGLGEVGTPIARLLLQAGYALTVHDLRRAAGTKLEALGARWADCPEGVAARSDAVLTALPTPAAVKTVVEGPNGLLSGMRAGSTWIDVSTNDRRELMRLARRARARDARHRRYPAAASR